MKRKTKSETYIRYLVQAFFLVFTTFLIIMHGKKGIAGGYPPIDTLCPFGGLETLYKFLSDGSFLKRVGPPAIVLFVGTIIGALIIGRAFCGSICPLGTMQEWLYNFFGKFIPSSLRRKMQVPSKVDKVLRYFKYIFFILILIFTWTTGTLVFRTFDPWATYGHIFGEWEELIEEFLLGTIILGLMFISTIFISRAWCKYLCPFVGILGPLSKISWLKINRDKMTCTDCKACNKNCPMDVDVASSTKVNSMECIECGSCESYCPVPDTLNRKSAAPSIKVKAFLIPLLSVVIFTGTYGVAKVSGIWRSVGDIASYGDIRGSNSIDQVAVSAGVSVHKLLEIAGLPKEMEKDADKMIKTFKSEEYKKKYNLSDDFETDVIREAFARIRGEEFRPEDDHGSESSSESVIKSGKKLVWGTDVKGSTALKIFFKASGKSKTEFIEEFSLPEDLSGETPIKDIRDKYGKEMEDMKQFFGIE